MKKSQFTSAILIILFVLTSNVENCPKVTAPAPPPSSDQFIADIFPKNNNTNIHLLNASAIITLNATNLINEIGIIFNGTYTLFNPDNPTNLTIILPFSLGLDVENATFGMSVNNTQVPFEIVSTSEDNLTSMGVNTDFIPKYLFFVNYPLTLITSNLTLLDNTTYVVKYQFEGSIFNPLSSRDLFYMVFSSETAKLWKGNATKRVEFKAFGGNPIFGTISIYYEGLKEVLDFPGGSRFICEWNNIQNNTIQIGIRFYGATPEFIPVEMIVLNILGYITITSVILIWIVWHKRKRS